PDLGVLAEVLLEDADGARAADVVGHEDVGVDPDVVVGLDVLAAGVAGEDFFGERLLWHGDWLRRRWFTIIVLRFLTAKREPAPAIRAPRSWGIIPTSSLHGEAWRRYQSKS